LATCRAESWVSNADIVKGLAAFERKVLRRIRKEKSNKIQQYIKILLFYIYMKLNMFRATHPPLSGA